MKYFSLLIIVVCAYFPVVGLANNNSPIKQFTSEFSLRSPASMALFTLPLNPNNALSMVGSIDFKPEVTTSFNKLTQISDSYEFEVKTRANDFTEQRRILPAMTFDFVVNNNKVIPDKNVQGLTLTKHPHWDYILGTGAISAYNNSDFYQVSLPFHLVEKNQNCVHNGVLTFLLNQQGQSSKFYYQISSETCLYYKVDMWGMGKTAVTIEEATTESKLGQFNFGKTSELNIKAITELPSTLDKNELALQSLIKPTDMSLYGLNINGQYYLSQCQTRHGLYPFCSELVLPSYSTAKTLFASLALYTLSQKHPNILGQKVSEWVPECSDEKWQNVTFWHLLNMTTGNYDSSHQIGDEWAGHSQEFFKATNHKDKIHYACEQFDNKSKPGEVFIYHTSDTYLLGTALQAFIKNKQGPQADILDSVLKPIWRDLRLSNVTLISRRTSDKIRQPFVGYGLFFKPSDISKITNFLGQQLSPKLANSTFKTSQLSTTMQRKKHTQDLTTKDQHINYSNGFWKKNLSHFINCNSATWVPFLSGYGGISIVLINDQIQYFYFSDSGVHNWRPAIKHLHQYQNICQSRSKQ